MLKVPVPLNDAAMAPRKAYLSAHNSNEKLRNFSVLFQKFFPKTGLCATPLAKRDGKHSASGAQR